MSPRKLLGLYAGYMGVWTALYFAVPSWRITAWAVIGASGAAAVVLGVRRHRPRRPVPWLLLGAAMLVFVFTDTYGELLNWGAEAGRPTPLVVHLSYLLMLVLLVSGMVGLVRSGDPGRGRAGFIDAATLGAGVGLISWMYLVAPRVDLPDLSGLQLVAAIAYPVADVLILTVVVRLVTAVRWSVSVVLLLAGALALFVGDVLYLLATLGEYWQMGGPVDIAWILMYFCWGAAALHPSMARVTDLRQVERRVLTKRRLVLLTVCSLSAPAVLLIESMRGTAPFGEVIAFVSAGMFLLVLTRLLDAMRAHRQSVARERGLREAGAALVAAAEEAQVSTAVRDAVARLLPPATHHRTVLAAGPSPADPGPADPGAGGSQLLCPRDLPPDEARLMSGFELVLRCPLRLADRRHGDTDAGTLLVGAPAKSLAVLQGAVEVLASQAALALERISLAEEINRRDSEAYFRTLVLNTADVVLILEEDNRIRYASPSAQTVFGRAVTGVDLVELVKEDVRPAAADLIGRARSGARDAPRADWTVCRSDGKQVQVEVAIRDLRRDPSVRGLVATLRDVTDQRQLEDELMQRAFHDSLTGLANRVLFTERVAQAVARTRRDGTVAGVLLIDLDDFKVVNDTLGHPAGDELLTAVAGRLTGVLRPGDLAGRLGGDEFAALIEDAGDPGVIERVAERVVGALSGPFSLGDNLVSGVASIGVATTLDAHDADELLRQADLAMYVAKGAGKGRWRRYQPELHAAIVDRMQLRTELDRAVATNAFSLRFQPVVGLLGGDTIGFEALVRWEHPTRGTLLPGDFIQVAEETGLIVPIGNLVLARALACAAAWPRHLGAGYGPYISINVSGRQFRTPGFIDEIEHQLDRSGMPPDRLLLEITESLLLREDEQIWQDLAYLRRLGIRVAIDDFGTGYSSLSYLRQVPLDVVKIDRSFIGAVGSSAQQRALVHGIVQLANTLGLEVIAEGIETEAERDILVETGCPYGQGHFYSEPLRQHEVVHWLAADTVAA